MRTPRLEINLNKVRHNTKQLVNLCNKYDMDLVAITKACGAMPEVAQAMLDGGAVALGDSHLQNLQRLRNVGIDCSLQLIRTPALSQVESVVQLADISMNVDLTVIEQLAEQDGIHQVVIMVDVGDNREGVQPDDVKEFVATVDKMDGIEVAGLGASTGCRHLVYATRSQVDLFVDVCHRVENRLERKLSIKSFGGTVALPLLIRGDFPKGAINQFRVGESLLLGEDAVEELPINGMYRDAFQLVAEVIEVRPNHEALLNIGSQDVQRDELILMQEGIAIVDDSSDHLIICTKDRFKVGQEVRFVPNYHGLVHLSTSLYVTYEFVES